MKSKIALILGISTLAISAAGCSNNTNTINQTESASETEETVTVIAFDTESVEPFEERSDLSQSKFCEMAATYYNMSEKEAKAMYQKITDSKILDKENMRLTGAVLNDYDGNGKTDMLVCLYEDTEDANSYEDGCLYLFMNDDEPYYIYDDFCCYYFGAIFGDFGVDIDHDGNTEIVFCVQGTGCGGAGDCQKFVIKYKGNEIERMELPNDFPSDYDYDIGLSVDVERDYGSIYKVYCPYFEETIVINIEDEDEDWGEGTNCRGYHTLAMTEHDGKQLLTGYEYLYIGYTANGIGDAVFLFDWDENGKVFVSDWYVEDWDGKIYVPFDRIQKDESSDGTLFGKDETGEEVKAYEEFLTGKRTANVAHNAHMDTSYIGRTITDNASDEEKNGFFLNDLMTRITTEMREGRGGERNMKRMEYALIDCGNDGKKQLALRAYGLDIYSENDDSNLTMVFDYKNGALSMIYAVDSWARSDMDLFKNGYVWGSGSGGAATHYMWEGIIKADGIYYKSYDCYMETGEGLSGMSSPWEIWDVDNSGVFPADFYEVTINDETIYAYYILDDVTDAEKKIVMDYIKDNEARMGIRFLTSEEALARMEKNSKALGITDDMSAAANRIAWKTLPTAK